MAPPSLDALARLCRLRRHFATRKKDCPLSLSFLADVDLLGPPFFPSVCVHSSPVYFVGNADVANRMLCTQGFPYYDVPPLNFFLPGTDDELSSAALESSADLAASRRRRSSHSDPPKNKVFPCTICGRKFNLKCNLNRHNLVHTGVRNYGCEVCGQRFVLRQHLKKHLERHAKGF